MPTTRAGAVSKDSSRPQFVIVTVSPEPPVEAVSLVTPVPHAVRASGATASSESVVVSVRRRERRDEGGR
ncbi:hypothetical protein [Prauserella sp. PE36]|uniref:hypothetical protein n=1 Tax=Prauserella sp. PE36 TaxID=1504709 RepID=UPI001F3AB376|nr:hypothetical protein [Prauserella sp. PE36]